MQSRDASCKPEFSKCSRRKNAHSSLFVDAFYHCTQVSLQQVVGLEPKFRSSFDTLPQSAWGCRGGEWVSACRPEADDLRQSNFFATLECIAESPQTCSSGPSHGPKQKHCIPGSISSRHLCHNQFTIARHQGGAVTNVTVPQQETVQCKQTDPKADVTVSSAGVCFKRAKWNRPLVPHLRHGQHK